MATEIAALIAAAEFADRADENQLATYPRETADDWFQSIDRLMYVRDTALAQRHGVSGYYVRLTPPGAVRDGGVPLPRSPLRLANQDLPAPKTARDRAIESGMSRSSAGAHRAPFDGQAYGFANVV
jgi:GH15 family glucan-1,4-alpha-glucosidase